MEMVEIDLGLVMISGEPADDLEFLCGFGRGCCDHQRGSRDAAEQGE